MRIDGLEIDVSTESVAWRSTRYRGVYWIDLRCSSLDEPRDSAALIRMDPGCGYPPHRHDGVEDVLVLRGGYQDELGLHEAGSYIRYVAGRSHAPVALGDSARAASRDNPACILFAVAHDGVTLLEDGRSLPGAGAP